MSRCKIWFFLSLLMVLSTITVEGTINSKARVHYNSLDPHSIPQHLAFYELYPNTPEGQKALRQTWSLLAGEESTADKGIPNLAISSSAIKAIVDLVNKQPDVATPVLSDSELAAIEKLARRLPNRQLKGHNVTSEPEVIGLPVHEIDLARGLFLSQVGEEKDGLRKTRSYEAMIDLMALQILSRLPPKASPERKIRAINHLVFNEMGFRFPPHSLYAKDVDTYTFLPSVLDSRHGVCLGVSVLYLCLAQRLDLPLEIVTPPGHIYIRYRNGDKVINIETTARGIHVDSEEYLGIDTRALEERNIKEVIGLTHINLASASWNDKNYEKALASFQKAHPYLPEDMLLKELLGYNYLFVGEKKKGENLLKEVEGYIPSHAITGHSLVDDYLSGTVDVEGIKALFLQVDETRESILKKKTILEDVVLKNPRFRDGLLSLATTWLQLHREREALHWLERYHALDPNDPTAEYYLAIVYGGRLDYNKAWEHFRNTERILEAKQHHPKALKTLRKELSKLYPE